MITKWLELGLLGIAIGCFGTLIGAGGGFILVPLLLLMYPADQPDVITSISLAVVFFNALSGSISYGRMRRIDFSAGTLFAAATIPGAILGALTTGYLPRRPFDVILGVVILAVAVFLFLKPRRQPGTGDAPTIDVDNAPLPGAHSYNRKLGALLSLAVGYLSSLLGIGGGIIHVPVLVRLLKFPVHTATATSHFVLAVMAGTGTLVHVATGAFQHGVRRTIALGIGVMIGAPFGAILSNRLRGTWIIRALAAALAAIGARLLLAGV